MRLVKTFSIQQRNQLKLEIFQRNRINFYGKKLFAQTFRVAEVAYNYNGVFMNDNDCCVGMPPSYIPVFSFSGSWHHEAAELKVEHKMHFTSARFPLTACYGTLWPKQ